MRHRPVRMRAQVFSIVENVKLDCPATRKNQIWY
uniref:Uncharacterized protein n=1 Tax=Rhizophora mucronata TaxID=61149 RepID=A0A2P2NW37_RHIMU